MNKYLCYPDFERLINNDEIRKEYPLSGVRLSFIVGFLLKIILNSVADAVV